MDYSEHLAQDARLIILRELMKQNSGSLNETILTVVLDSFGHRQSREWVQTQLNKMKDLGAVTVLDAGVLVATITRAGIDHVERRSLISGIAKPSPEV
ncbi:MAG: hypothetical protein QM488_18470 [Rhizobiaceae bacterium]